MRIPPDQWTLTHLRQHLQFAVDLEFWTIPFYMSAMFSIKDRSSKAFQAIQSVVHQEMLHVQLSCNVSNAFGHCPAFPPPVYLGETVPHLRFDLDDPDPRDTFHPASAEIGPLDELRLNSMCLIEFPDYDTTTEPDLYDTLTEYGSIAAFYDAVEFGAAQLAEHIRGGVNQIDMFSAFYRDMPQLTVAGSGRAALPEVKLLIDAIRDQGEARKSDQDVQRAFRNTADDSYPNQSHFEKFIEIREGARPPIYLARDPGSYSEEDKSLQRILIDNFASLLSSLESLFSGANPPGFEALMVTVGANIQNCWKHQVLPKFS